MMLHQDEFTHQQLAEEEECFINYDIPKSSTVKSLPNISIMKKVQE